MSGNLKAPPRLVSLLHGSATALPDHDGRVMAAVRGTGIYGVPETEDPIRRTIAVRVALHRLSAAHGEQEEQRNGARLPSDEMEAVVVLGLLTAALVLVSVVALLHTRQAES